MVTVETTIRVSIPDGADFEEVERRVSEAMREVGRELVVTACGRLEEGVLARERDQLRREKQRALWLLTGFGWVQLQRWQVYHRAKGRYWCPLDEVLGLSPRQHASPWVQKQAVALASRLPYRQAALLLRELVGGFVDHRTVHEWVQRAGAALVAEENSRQEAVFGRGEDAAGDSRVREIVVAEVDGTFIKAQREKAPDFEVRLGVLYSGKEVESATARHRRYRLCERVRYGGVETADSFGECLFLAGEVRLGLSRAQHLLLVGDGAEWIEALAGHQRWRATYPLDWWHLSHAIHRTFPDRPQLVGELTKALYGGDGSRLLALVATAQALGIGDRERVRQLQGYLRANQAGLYGARRLREQLSPQARLVAVEGSGAIEKQMDVVIGRRFKGQGMRWTKAGANRLLKLRLRELDRAA